MSDSTTSYRSASSVVIYGDTFTASVSQNYSTQDSGTNFFASAQNIVISGGNFVNDFVPQPQTRISAGPASLSESPSDSVVSPDASIDQNVQNFISSVEEALDGSETEEIDEAENVVFDGDRPVNRTYYINCQAVYTNSFNAKGNKVKDSGNHIPQVSSYRGGKVVVRPSNDKRPTSSNEGTSPSNSLAALAQSSRSLDALLDSTFGSPPVIPPLPFQLSSSAQSGPTTSDPAIEIPKPSRSNNPFLNQLMVVPPADLPLPTLEEGHVSMSSRKRGKLPATIETKLMLTNAATSHFTSATSTLPGPESQPFPVNPFLPMHMGLRPNFLLPPNLEPFPGTIQNTSSNNITVNPSRDMDPQHHPAESLPASDSSLDTNPKRHLEYLLESALATALTIQASGISSSADILSPRALNTLKALNALVSVEIPETIADDPPARFKNVTKWFKLRIPQ